MRSTPARLCFKSKGSSTYHWSSFAGSTLQLVESATCQKFSENNGGTEGFKQRDAQIESLNNFRIKTSEDQNLVKSYKPMPHKVPVFVCHEHPQSLLILRRSCKEFLSTLLPHSCLRFSLRNSCGVTIAAGKHGSRCWKGGIPGLQ